MSEPAPEQWWLTDLYAGDITAEQLRTPSPEALPHFMRQPPAQDGPEQPASPAPFAPSAPAGSPAPYGPYGPPPEADHTPPPPPPPLPHEEAYDRWDRTEAGRRPVPSMEVVAGHAGKKFAYKIHGGDLRAFEMAHGIPSGMLEIARDVRRNPIRLRIADGRQWEPGRYRAPANLAPEALEVVAAIAHQDANPTRAHRLWRALPPHQRPAPNGKVVAGFAEKNAARLTKRTDVDRFADEYAIPRGDLVLLRSSSNRQVIGAALRTGAPWPPVAWEVPSARGAVAGNPLGAAARHTSPGSGQGLAGPSSTRGSASASSALGRLPSRSAPGPQRGRGM